jgi:predicted alpha/beta-fold hydrolase
MERGFARLYRRRLINDMQAKLKRKFRQENAPFHWQRAMRARSFLEFDDAVTAPLHGFSGAGDYYRRSSCLPYLRLIAKPTLIVHAEDDPFLDPTAIPQPSDLSASVTLELSRTGGHVGFLEAYAAGRPRMWLPERVLDFLQSGPARSPDA